MQITVYTTPSCPQCEMTKKVLTRGEVEFEVVDLSANPEAMTYVKEELGYASAPVVTLSNGQHWSGFRNEYLKSLINLVHAEDVRAKSHEVVAA